MSGKRRLGLSSSEKKRCSLRAREGSKNMRGISGTFPRCVLVLGAGLLMMASSMAWASDDKEKSDIDKRIQNATTVLNEVMATPDKAIPDKVMNQAKCIAVIPSMVKIAVGFGGNHGKGLSTCR